MLSFSVSPNTDELTALHIYNAWDSPQFRNRKRRAKFGVPIAALLFGVAILLREEYIIGGIFISIAIIWLLGYDTLYRRNLKAFAQGYYNHPINRRYWASTQYTFDNKKITIKNEYAAITLKWKAILDVREQADAIWLFESLHAAYIIPKRQLSEEQLNLLRQILSQNLVRE